jgi:hypothetical protein
MRVTPPVSLVLEALAFYRSHTLLCVRDDDHEHAGLVRGGEEGLGSSWGACGWMRSGPNAVKCLIHYHLRGWWCSGSVVWCWCCRRSATAHEIRCSSLRKLYLQVVQVAMRGLRWSSPLAGRLVRAGPLLACLLHDWLSCTTGCDAWLRRAPRTGAPAGWLLAGCCVAACSHALICVSAAPRSSC